MLELFDWDQEAMEFLELKYEQYISDLFVSMDDPDPMQSETGLLFCGCETCFTRETFAYLMPRFIDLFEQGLISKQHPNKEVPSDQHDQAATE